MTQSPYVSGVAGVADPERVHFSDRFFSGRNAADYIARSPRRFQGAGVTEAGPGSATPATPQGRRAFTLLEVLLSIAIIALLAGVLVGGAAHLLSEEPVTANDIFWKSVQEARKAALKSEHDIRLKYDKERKQFVLIDGFAPPALAADGITLEEKPIKTFPLPPQAAANLTVELLGPASKGGTLNLIGGVLMETQSLAYATFYSDGTCSPFRAQFARGGGASVLSVDPWTCAQVLTPTDPNALPGG